MSSEWKLYSLHELGRIVTGKTPKSGNPDFEGNAFPFITPPDFIGNKWIKNPIRAFSKIGAQSVKNCLLREKSVLITCIGSDMGKAALAATKCFTNQQINAIEVDEARFCPEFIYYNLSLRKDEIRAIAGGSAQPILNKTAFGKIDIFVPPLDEQKKISDFLRPLDDRIILLRETNTTLEAIAQALFKSWFVDFDPIHAKQQGRAPEGMDAQTAELFPDSFEESELGMVPKGWRVSELKAIATITMGLSPKGDSYNSDGNGFPLINGPVEFGEYFPEKSKWTTAADRFCEKDDLIFCVRGSTTGRRIISDGKYCIGRGVCSIRALGGRYSFLYQTINFGIDRLLSKATGSVFPNLSAPDIKEFQIIGPSPGVMDAFEEFTSQMLLRQHINQMKIKKLAELRDTLLPRLISGQLRLPEAQALVEDAGDA